MTYEQLIGDLKNKVYKPVYFLWGEEPYYIDLATSFISQNVLSEAEQSFNQSYSLRKGLRGGSGIGPGTPFSHDGLPPGGGSEGGPGDERLQRSDPLY